MTIIKQPASLSAYIRRQNIPAPSVGFVPTMGALHQGHLELVKRSSSECRLTICSIFVNPTQFNDAGDLAKYPRTLESDIVQLAKAGADVLFLPLPASVYPEGMDGLETYALGSLETILEGEYRPGHFQGVCQVMSRLLDICSPGRLYMGQKDYQQCMVVARLLQLTGSGTELIACPTVREPGGLAMSSRNLRLSAAQREIAPGIFKTLLWMKQQLTPGSTRPLEEQALQQLRDMGFRPDYIELAEKDTLKPVDRWDGQKPLVILAAAFLGDVRLIDNLIIG